MKLVIVIQSLSYINRHSLIRKKLAAILESNKKIFLVLFQFVALLPQCLSSIYKVNAKKFAIDVEFKSRRQSPQPDRQIPKPHKQIHADNISMHEDLLILLLIRGKRKYCMSLPLSYEIFKTFSLVFDDLTNNKVVFGDKACSPRMVVKSACLALQFLTTDISVLKLHGKKLQIQK